jgi:DNA-binding NarL/FixJ family response regulator
MGGEPERQDISSSASVRVLIVEDHPLLADALQASLQREEGFSVDVACDLRAATPKVDEGVDLLILDLDLPDGFGAELIQRALKGRPGAKVLVYSATTDHGEIRSVLRAGADGFLHKSAASWSINAAARQVLAGHQVLDRIALDAARSFEATVEAAQEAHLTNRELEVLRRLAQGDGTEQVARALSMGSETVRTHLKSIYRKLNVDNRSAAVAVALRRGLVE